MYFWGYNPVCKVTPVIVHGVYPQSMDLFHVHAHGGEHAAAEPGRVPLPPAKLRLLDSPLSDYFP